MLFRTTSEPALIEGVLRANLPTAKAFRPIAKMGKKMGREVATKGMDGIGELIIMAPIKPGVIDAYETITFESRLRFVAEAMFKIEVNGREHESFTPFADVADRIQNVFNFRIGVVDQNLTAITPETNEDGSANLTIEPRRTMILIATYDGPFEPYLRLIWDPLGPFLDLLLCNCEGYKLSSETGFPEYIQWVRDHLVEPSIFYSTSSNTLRDQFYLADLEKLQRELDPAKADSDLRLAALTGHTSEQRARASWDDPLKQPTAVRLSFEALNVLYRLADYYPPDRPEGRILLKATQDLLLNLHERVAEIQNANSTEQGTLIAQQMLKFFLGVPGQSIGPYTEHWAWFRSPLPLRQPTAEIEPENRGEIQRGLLSDYDSDGFHTTHGMTLLYTITDPLTGGDTILQKFPISWDNEPFYQGEWAGQPVRFYCNVAFTAPGLRAMQVPPADLALFPKEFRDGLFQRASMIGDVRDSHPRRWKFPRRFDPATFKDDPTRPTIHSEEIDLVVQLRFATKWTEERVEAVDFIPLEEEALALEGILGQKENGLQLLDLFDRATSVGLGTLLSPDLMGFGPEKLSEERTEAETLSRILQQHDLPVVFLMAFIRQQRLSQPAQRDAEQDDWLDPGLRLLAIESTFRPLDGYDSPLPDVQLSNRDHFGFRDGISQPKPGLDAPEDPREHYSDRIPYGDILCGYRNSVGDNPDDLDWNNSNSMLKNGSFMVLRKIAQFPDRLEKLGGPNSPVAAAIVGRTADGAPLLGDQTPELNDFNYKEDLEQERCPFSAHIRLANPRDEFQRRPAARILRRGMSYGPRYIPGDTASAAAERGVLFMAWNASLAEQYEVIQRWLNAGNPTGVSSAANDPLTGARRTAGPHTFRYRDSNGVQRVTIDKPLSEVRWGLYAFAPSRSALEKICLPKASAEFPGDLMSGQATINRILALPPEQQRPEWKRLLEDYFVKDMSDLGETPPVWRAIRDIHKGVLRIEAGVPYGEEGMPTHKVPIASDAVPVVLVAKGELIKQVLADPVTFSSSERSVRTRGSIGEHYVAMDFDARYEAESRSTNEALFAFSNGHRDDVFDEAYKIASDRLARAKQISGGFKNDFFKIDLRRDFLVPVLGQLCTWLFDIPDARIFPPRDGFIDLGPWGWQPVDRQGNNPPAKDHRKPRCPADFMAPSRFSFTPRPTPAIQNYGVEHGNALRNAALNLVRKLRSIEASKPGEGFKGQLSSRYAKVIADDELLARNIVGSMTGAIAPLDTNLRGVFYDWIDAEAMWRQQSAYLSSKSGPAPNLGDTEEAIGAAIRTAMCKRPAPDLLYRTATVTAKIGEETVNAGETVLLALISPLLEELDGLEPGAAPDVGILFGGRRSAGWQVPPAPIHACPAYSLTMAMYCGIVAALFDAGRIVIQPASMILQITDWDGPPGHPVTAPELFEPEAFTPFD